MQVKPQKILLLLSLASAFWVVGCRDRDWKDLSYEEVTEDQVFAYQEKQKAIRDDNFKQAIAEDNTGTSQTVAPPDEEMSGDVSEESGVEESGVEEGDVQDSSDVAEDDLAAEEKSEEVVENPEGEEGGMQNSSEMPEEEPTPEPLPNPVDIPYFKPENISLILNAHCLSCHDWVKVKSDVESRINVIDHRVFGDSGRPMPKKFRNWEDVYVEEAEALKAWLDEY